MLSRMWVVRYYVSGIITSGRSCGLNYCSRKKGQANWKVRSGGCIEALNRLYCDLTYVLQ